MLETTARILDLLLLSFTFGATVWFFFVQSPVLLKWMGKEKFLPIQMKLTKVLFQSLAIVVPLMLGLTFVHGQDQFWLHVSTAGLAAIGALANHFIVVPRALRAGGRALRDVRGGEDDRSVSGFASQGGGEASKMWHRLVVVFVVVMLAGAVGHGVVLTSNHDHSTHVEVTEHGHPELQPADEDTKRNVAQLHQVVSKAIDSDAEPASVSADARAAYQQIFKDCKMTGEAHEHLHAFLVPIGPMLERLGQNDAAALDDLDAHLQSFEKRFR